MLYTDDFIVDGIKTLCLSKMLTGIKATRESDLEAVVWMFTFIN